MRAARTRRVTGGHVLIASDKFKGSLTAAEVGAAVGAGLRRVVPDLDVVVVPVADGGDGTLAAAFAAGYSRSRSPRPGRPASPSTPATPGTMTWPWSNWPTSPGSRSCPVGVSHR